LFASLTSRVSTRLAAGFGIVIASVLALATYGGLRLHDIDAEVDFVVSDRMVRVDRLDDLKDNANVSARALRNLLLLDAADNSAREAERKRIADAQAKSADLIKVITASLNTDKGRHLMTELSGAGVQYAALLDQAMQLVAGGKDPEARAMLFKEIRPVQSAYFKGIDDLVDLQQALMKQSAKQAGEMAHSATLVMLALALAAAVAGSVVAWNIIRGLGRQLGGEPAYAREVAREIGAGNLALEVHVNAGADKSLLAEMKHMQQQLAGIVAQVRSSSDSIATGSAQIATGNADLSQRTEEQASNLEQTAASMEQLSGTVKASADTAGHANELAGSASLAATKGGEMVGRVVGTMQEIAASSKKIADIIGVIDGIAFQTNILALNAAVEAARAGEQGRGFAVVASEVRSLASRSAEAAKEIKSLIGASVEKVETGTQQVNDAGASMGEIVSQVKRVSELISEISRATIEQSTGIGQVGEAVTQLDQVTQQNAALVEESAAAADSLKQQAARMAEVVSVFKLAA
jgi:methyl-accepting chemotaxis protein